MLTFIDYKTGKGSLASETNNYLFILEQVSLEDDYRSVRRYIRRIIKLYNKINSLPVSLDNSSIEHGRAIRKNKRYSDKIKGYFDLVLKKENSIFLKVSEMLKKENEESFKKTKRKKASSSFNKYSSDEKSSSAILEILLADISEIYKNRVNSLEKSNKKKKKETQKIQASDKKSVDKKEDVSDVKKKKLSEAELEKLKHDIDIAKIHKVSELEDIDNNQKKVIDIYMDIVCRCRELDSSLVSINNNSSESFATKVCNSIFDLAVCIRNGMFEQIELSAQRTVSHNDDSKDLDVNAIYDSSLLRMFEVGHFIKRPEVYMDELGQYFPNINNNELLKENKLLSVTSEDIYKSLEHTLSDFILDSCGKFVEGLYVSKNKTYDDDYYELGALIKFVSAKTEKFSNLYEKVISYYESLNSKDLKKDDKKNVLSNLTDVFVKNHAVRMRVQELPEEVQDYAVSEILNKVYTKQSKQKDLTDERNEAIEKIYQKLKAEYDSLTFSSKLFGKVTGNVKKPSMSDAALEIADFDKALTSFVK